VQRYRHVSLAVDVCMLRERATTLHYTRIVYFVVFKRKWGK